MALWASFEFENCHSVLHGLRVRVARRPGRALLQRRPDGDHAEDLREHQRGKEVRGLSLILPQRAIKTSKLLQLRSFSNFQESL